MTRPVVCLLNRVLPPFKGATGLHTHQLAKYLHQADIFDVWVITQKHGTVHEKVSDSYQVRYVPVYYKGKNSILRFLDNFFSSILLLFQARRLNPFHTIVLTDPPFLNFWASFMLPKKRWSLWVMDIYPQAFVANGLVTRQNIFYKFYSLIVKKSKPLFLIALGKGQQKYLQENYTGIPAIICPVGIHTSLPPALVPPSWYTPELIHFGYFGTLGEAHCLEFIDHFARSIDPRRHRLIISAFGSKLDKLMNSLLDLSHVKFISPFDDFAFSYIEVQLVTLIKNWTHISVPSKAFTAMACGSAVIFNGSDKSDTWAYIKEAGWLIEQFDEIKPTIKSISHEELKVKRQNAIALSKGYHHDYIKAFTKIKSHILDGK